MRRFGDGARLRWLGTVACLFAAAACARPEIPPGGPEDRLPPIVVETVPDTFATVEPGLREFRFRFSERISERPSNGTLDNAVVVSPPVGNVRVRHGRDGITIQAQQGLEANRIYRVTVLPVINDMFGNRLRDPFDLVVSTGAELMSNVVAGVVEDRVTGRASENARVEAVFEDETGTQTHWNLTGEDGIFSLRYVPLGNFRARAWLDRNRNDSADSREPQSEWRQGGLADAPDTSFVVLSLVEPDTTPAQLVSVTAVDSTTLRFEFDDFLNPAFPGAAIDGLVRWEQEAGDTASLALQILQEHEHRVWQAQRADSAARAAAEEAGEELPEPDADVAGGEEDDLRGPVGLSGLLLPSQTLLGVLRDGMLEPGITYEASVRGAVNIAGEQGQLVSALFAREVPEAAAEASDSAQALPDTLRADTLQVPPDSARTPPDTLAAPPSPRIQRAVCAVSPLPVRVSSRRRRFGSR